MTNHLQSSRLTRRRVFAGATTIALAAKVGVPWMTVAERARPVQVAGRSFVDQSSTPDTRSLTATIRLCESSAAAQREAHDRFAKATAPITNMEASISEVYRQPLDDPYGIDGRWTIVAGAAGIASYHRGLFFAVDRLCWSLDAGRLEEPDDHAFLVPLAKVLRDRFNTLGSDEREDIDLWALLPEEHDLGGRFRLVKSFDHDDDGQPV